jgi:hypothetical protein
MGKKNKASLDVLDQNQEDARHKYVWTNEKGIRQGF